MPAIQVRMTAVRSVLIGRNGFRHLMAEGPMINSNYSKGRYTLALIGTFQYPLHFLSNSLCGLRCFYFLTGVSDTVLLD